MRCPASLAVRNSRTRFKHRTWFGTQTRSRRSTARTRFASLELGRDSSRISRRVAGSRVSSSRESVGEHDERLALLDDVRRELGSAAAVLAIIELLRL